MKRKVNRWLRIVSLITVLSIVALPGTALAHTPPFFCQAAGNYIGGYWGSGVPQAKISDIASGGCAISSAAMVLNPSTANIYDERVGYTRNAAADPYVVYRANGDSNYANWATIKSAFGWTTWFHYSLGSDVGQNAITVDSYIDNGDHPIGRIPGHFITFVSSSIIGPLSEGEVTEIENPNISTDPVAVTEAEIEPLTDTDFNKKPKKPKKNDQEDEVSAVWTQYDMAFRIHDPGTRYGENIYFSGNIKGVDFSALDRLTIYR